MKKGSIIKKPTPVKRKSIKPILTHEERLHRMYCHPERVIKVHNQKVMNLVENEKVMKIDLNDVFIFLNRKFF